MLYQIDAAAEKMAEYVHENGGTVVVDGDEFDERTQRNLRILMFLYYQNIITIIFFLTESTKRIWGFCPKRGRR